MKIKEFERKGDRCTNKLYFDIGQRLLLRRRELNCTQEQVAELLGMSTAYYGKIERGEKGPSLDKLILIYRRLGIDITYLLTGKKAEFSFDNIMIACPDSKRYDLEQLIKYAMNLAILK